MGFCGRFLQTSVSRQQNRSSASVACCGERQRAIEYMLFQFRDECSRSDLLLRDWRYLCWLFAYQAIASGVHSRRKVVSLAWQTVTYVWCCHGGDVTWVSASCGLLNKLIAVGCVFEVIPV